MPRHRGSRRRRDDPLRIRFLGSLGYVSGGAPPDHIAGVRSRITLTPQAHWHSQDAPRLRFCRKCQPPGGTYFLHRWFFPWPYPSLLVLQGTEPPFHPRCLAVFVALRRQSAEAVPPFQKSP